MASTSMRRLLPVLGLATAVTLNACGDFPAATSPPAGDQAATLQEPAVSAVSVDQDYANTVARSIAMAMNDRAVQVHIRNAMRDSRYQEHKLDLRAFLQENSSRLLLTRAAAAAGMSQGEFVQLVEGLPRLEFYVPDKAHRLQWSPGQPFAVSAVVNPEELTSPVAALYEPTGGVRNVNVVQNMPQDAVFFLLPVEADFSRPPPFPVVGDYRGPHIQSTKECHPLAVGCLSDETFDPYSPGKNSTLSADPLGDVLADGTGTLATGRIKYFELLDDKDWIGSNEIEVWYWIEGTSEDPGEYMAGWHSPNTPPCVRFTGIDAEVEYHHPASFGNYYPASGVELGTEFMEDDDGACVLNSGDDLIGRPDNYFEPENGTAKSEAYPHASIYSREYVQWEDNLGGGGTQTEAFVLLEVHYHLSVTIEGPEYMDPWEQGSWTADVSDGSGNYSYQWYKDDYPVGTNSSTYTTTAGIADFRLFVRVTDTTTGAIATNRQTVIVCSDDGVCPQ